MYRVGKLKPLKKHMLKKKSGNTVFERKTVLPDKYFQLIIIIG
jgi:hypothetical protein